MRLVEFLTEERLAATWMRIPESLKRQLNKDRFMAMKSVQDWKSVTEHLQIEDFGKLGENMVRGTFEFLFGDYIMHLEVIGASDWIDVKMMLEFDGVRYEFLIEVKTSRITRRNAAAVPIMFRKKGTRKGEPAGRRADGHEGTRAGGQHEGTRAREHEGRRVGGQEGRRTGGQEGRRGEGHEDRITGVPAGRRARGHEGRRESGSEGGGQEGRRAGG